MKRLLVGYDGSDQAREAAAFAGRLARRLAARVTVLTVGSVVYTADTTMTMPAVDERALVPLVEEGAEIVRALGAEADARVAVGEPALIMCAMARQEGDDLIVVGHRGMGDIAELMLGSVAKRLAASAPCPVLVVRGAAPETVRKVLAGEDGSEHARRALEGATMIARAFGARITLLYVLDSQALAAAGQGAEAQRLRRTLLQAGREALARASEVCARAGVDCEAVQVEGRPPDVICDRAQEGGYDLVAVGRRGMSGIARLVLGSVSDAVLRRAGPLVLLASEQ